MKGPAGGISIQANVPGESAERPGGAMLPVAGLVARLEGTFGAAGTVPLVPGGVGTELNKGPAGLLEGGVEAGWGLTVGVGGLNVAFVGVGVASVGEALLAGGGVVPAGGVAAGGVAAGGCCCRGVCCRDGGGKG